ncbi:MAG: MerR family transcriptional regulator [Synergistaceae bacterium]|jgi:DNA-binding transcriptional MerR regulator|nr:MerR family transcriptional regulator [Synergistaceae bacterium]
MKLYMKVGEFSRITGLSHKALRLYDRAALLVPAYTDEATRYRYYLPNQITDAIRIKILRGFGVSLDNIKSFVSEKTPERLNGFFTEQKEKLKRLISEHERNLILLDQLTKEPNNVFETYGIKMRDEPDVPVVSIREKVRKEHFDKRVAERRDELKDFLRRSGERACGSSFALLHHEEFSTKVFFDLETCVPVSEVIATPQGINSRKVGGGAMVSTLHKGSYEWIPAAYGAILRWIGNNSYVPLRPMREVYITEPDERMPENNRTLVLWPVK